MRERRQWRREPPSCYQPGVGLRQALIVACVLAVGCGQKPSQPPERKDAATPRDAAVVVELAERPLGLADLAAFAWRKRGGHNAFREARTAEGRQDWPGVVAACQQALAADPTHLEASWLLAAALGRLGKHDQVLAPLQVAVAGDFGKWGIASLQLPALAGFHATPAGAAWKDRVEQDRTGYLAVLARSTVVTASGDLFAFDPVTARWNRLTRTGGAVLGGLSIASARKIAYVARQGDKTKRVLAVGVVDLARGRTTRPVPFATPGAITIAYSTKAPIGVWVATGAKKPTWFHLEDDYKPTALPPKTARPNGWRLEAKGTSLRLSALPVPKVTADWDDDGLASAIRIGSSNRVVSAPSPGLIDGHTARWSPGKTHLAFVAQLDETCTPGTISAAAFIADAATGKLNELERAAKGLAIEWITDRKLAIAGDTGVSIVDLDGAPPLPLAGATNLVTPRKRPKCSEEPVEEPVVIDEEEAVPVNPPDAGVVGPP